MKFLSVVLVLLSTFSFCQTLSEQGEISIVTCGPGQEELYTAFGHSAIRIKDPIRQLDLAFNYGVFNFDQPNFYINFARGYLYYKLGVDQYDHFEYPYVYYNRYVHEQKLNLTQKQKNDLFKFLVINARPENQYYRYDYFYNNCATKMRDVIKEVLKDSVEFNTSHIKTDYTIRELTDLYLDQQPWGDLGIDICLGLPMDKKAAPIEYMFLPEFVEAGFANAFIFKDGKREPLVLERIVAHQETNSGARETLISPLLIFSLIFFVACILSYFDLRRRTITYSFDIPLFTVLGILGLLLLLLWVATDHEAAARNLNLLYALPFHLVAVVAFFKQPRWLKQYFFVTLIISASVLVLWPVLPQKLHYALVPLVLTTALRSFVQYRLRP